jgi:hypothetical protein
MNEHIDPEEAFDLIVDDLRKLEPRASSEARSTYWRLGQSVAHAHTASARQRPGEIAAWHPCAELRRYIVLSSSPGTRLRVA